jgi:hypothetical protein
MVEKTGAINAVSRLTLISVSLQYDTTPYNNVRSNDILMRIPEKSIGKIKNSHKIRLKASHNWLIMPKFL